MLKSIKFSFLILTLCMVPVSLHANNDGTNISVFVAYFESDEECAVETTFTSFSGGGFITGTEGLYVDGTLWADLSGLPTSGYSVGDKISWGTLELSARLNYQFDVTLDTDFCRNLKLGARLSYRGTNGTDLAEFDFDEAPSLNMSYTFNKGSGIYEGWDLMIDPITIEGLGGNSITFGGGTTPTPGGGSNGCQLAPQTPASGSGFLFSMGLTAILMGLFYSRFRRS